MTTDQIETLKRQIAQRIRARREYLQLSQAEAAARINWDSTRWSKGENCRSVSLESLLEMAGAVELNVSLSASFSGKGEG